MNKYYNPYNRIQFYYSYLNVENLDSDTEYDATTIKNMQYTTQIAELDEEYNDAIGYSIHDLSLMSRIPKEIIRQDIYLIFLWLNQFSDLNTYIYFDEDIDSPTHEQFISGELDNYLLILHTPDYTTSEIPVTPEEQQALELLKKDTEQTPSISFPSTSDWYLVKDSYRFHHEPHTIHYLNEIDKAINEHRMVTITYRSSKQKKSKKHLPISFLPVKIAYDATDNLYYVLSVGKKKSDIRSYRIDRISRLDLGNKVRGYYPDLSFLMQIAPNVWGCNFSAVSDPKNLFHVKVRFSNVGNVFNKVRKDLACRTNGKLYEKNDFLYYEDDVYDIDKFRSWIFSYGRAVTVLEPEVLRRQIIDSLEARL